MLFWLRFGLLRWVGRGGSALGGGEGLVDLGLGEVFVVDEVVEELGERGEALLDVFGVGVEDALCDFVESVAYDGCGSLVLLFEDDSRIAAAHFAFSFRAV